MSFEEAVYCPQCGNALEPDDVILDGNRNIGICSACRQVNGDYEYINDYEEIEHNDDFGYCENCGSSLFLINYRIIDDPLPAKYIEQYTCVYQFCILQGDIVEFD